MPPADAALQLWANEKAASGNLHMSEIEPLRHTYAHVAELIGGDKPATRYREVTLGAQPAANFHYRPTWDPEHELYDASRTRVKLKNNRYALSDPRQFYYAIWTTTRARQQEAVEVGGALGFRFLWDRKCAQRSHSMSAPSCLPEARRVDDHAAELGHVDRRELVFKCGSGDCWIDPLLRKTPPPYLSSRPSGRPE